MFRNMVTSFFKHGQITTTDAKAKELRPIAEKMITLGKRGDLHARRLAASFIRDNGTVAKLFTEIAPRYADRPGGYTRIVKLGIRSGDTAPVSLIQLVEEQVVKKESRKPVKKQVAAKAAPAAVEVVPAEKTVTESEAAPVSSTIQNEENCVAEAD